MTIKEQIESRRKMRGPDYQPRTRHLSADGEARYTNRLFLESSPYLLQHAHNPVDWYPWGAEAFEIARQRHVPVLVSIGYSTCHWCHVMEEESFEDEEIAAYLNQHYVAVKVDREERPDIDSVYMTAVQAITGRGGWPLNVFLTPDRKPFYGGTYFPARDGDRGTPVGFLSLLQRLQTAFAEKYDMITRSSVEIITAIKRMLETAKGDARPDFKLLQQAMDGLKHSFDPDEGGLQGTMKFPSSLPIRLLFRYHHRTFDTEALHMATHTLRKMASGGIYDHIGGGFHRYATDTYWLVPHFEKMLYDNALLIVDYLEGYQITGDQTFKRIAEETLEYIYREMTSPEGAFYSATDADSLTPEGHREEGYYFTWTPDEIEAVLGRQNALRLNAYYAVEKQGNFEGRSILHTPRSIEEVAGRLGISASELQTMVSEAKAALYQARNQRPRPLRDEKILTAWNGLMISAHARAGFIFKAEKYIQRAAKAANFIWESLYQEGTLYRSYNDGEAKYMAFLDDYAFYCQALLDLFETTSDIIWLQRAVALDHILEEHFEDPHDGGFYRTGSGHETLIAREKPFYDGALPSGNAIALLNLLKLSEWTLKDTYRQRAAKGLNLFLSVPHLNPLTVTSMLVTLDFYLGNPKAIVIVTPQSTDRGADLFLAALRENFVPNRVLTVVIEGQAAAEISQWVPLLHSKTTLQGVPVAYVCEKGRCALPTTDFQLFLELIRGHE